MELNHIDLCIGLIEEESDITQEMKDDPNLHIAYEPEDGSWPAAWVWNTSHWKFVGREKPEGPYTTAGHYYGDEYGYFVPVSDVAKELCALTLELTGYYSWEANGEDMFEEWKSRQS